MVSCWQRFRAVAAGTWVRRRRCSRGRIRKPRRRQFPEVAARIPGCCRAADIFLMDAHFNHYFAPGLSYNTSVSSKSVFIITISCGRKQQRCPMKHKSCVRLACLGFAAGIFILARQAGAALGETENSISSDRKALSAVHRATTVNNAYTIQEMQSESSTVREYVSSAGVVFAVAWNGRIHPDLTTLLGSYAGEYKAALQQTTRKRGLRRQQVSSGHVVVEKWGHMRNLQGRAYNPALVPSGVTIDEIR